MNSNPSYPIDLGSQWPTMDQMDPSNVWYSLAGYALMVIALWPVFTKGGYPGWGAIIPFYNIYVLIKLAGFHGATILWYLLPVFNIIWAIIVAHRIGKAFGKGGFFSFFLLWLLPIIGYLIIGYGRARYRGRPGPRPIVR